MTEFYIELQDSQGTCYIATDITDEVVYFENLAEACMYAKDQLNEQLVSARVINNQTRRIMDIFHTRIK